ncbi:hypothetical protein ACWC4C_39865 [Streptomyces olivaceoviridis]
MTGTPSRKPAIARAGARGRSTCGECPVSARTVCRASSRRAVSASRDGAQVSSLLAVQHVHREPAQPGRLRGPVGFVQQVPCGGQ